MATIYTLFFLNSMLLNMYIGTQAKWQHNCEINLEQRRFKNVMLICLNYEFAMISWILLGTTFTKHINISPEFKRTLINLSLENIK